VLNLLDSVDPPLNGVCVSKLLHPKIVSKQIRRDKVFFISFLL